LTIENIKKKIDLLLKEAKFETLYFEYTTSKKGKYCFDSLVKKGNSVFLVKVFPNIDNLNQNIIDAIKKLSLLLKSKPLLIGIKNRYQSLEENTIYIRDELPFISLETFENILKSEIYPYILARRGGGVIFLDGNLMKTLREQLYISRKEISEKLGVTKRTVCSYENESIRPSQKMADKILEILEDKSIFRNIDIFEWNFKVHFDQKDVSQIRELTDFEINLQDIFEHIGMSTIWYKGELVPFKLSLSSKKYILGLDEEDQFYPLFSGVSQESENKKLTKMGINHLMKFADLFHKNALFIVNNDFKIPDAFKKSKIPIIKIKNLENMDNKEDFIEIFKSN
jgi:predicted transcriptional regulator